MTEEMSEFTPETPLSKPRPGVWRGHGRVFFITLFAAVLMQSFSFFYMQARAVSSALHADFKIIITLNSASADRVNEIGAALSSNPDVLGLKFISAEDGFEMLKAQHPRLAENFVFLGRKPMADYFVLTADDAALADIDAWVKDNISSQIPDAQVFYKTEAAAAAAYAAQELKFFNFIAGILLVVLFSFVFFVEGLGSKPESPRWPGIFAGILAYGVSLGLFYVLLSPLRRTGGGFFVFTVAEVQCVIAFITMVLGWVFAKWKRF